MAPAFSIIMPTYNRAWCLKNTIDAILSQSYQRFELIIIDDDSTDNTTELLENDYSCELKNGKIVYQKIAHGGPCIARNTGLTLAKNEWIAYVDSDNSISPNFLGTFASAIFSNPEYKCFYSKFTRIHDQVVVGHEFNIKELYEHNYIDMGVFVHHRSLISELGNFDSNYFQTEDWDLIFRYCSKYPPYFINLSLLNYNDSKTDTSRITARNRYQEDFIYFHKKHTLTQSQNLIQKTQLTPNTNLTHSDLTIAICNFNTTQLTEQCIDSVIANSGLSNYRILVLDNSDREPFKPSKQYDCVKILDNTKSQLLNFNEILSSFSNLHISLNNNGSLKHAYSIQYLLNICTTKFLLLFDSDTLLKTKIDFIDDQYITVADIHKDKWFKPRFEPYIQLFNVEFIQKNHVKYFNQFKMCGGITSHGKWEDNENRYDTGASFYEAILQKKYKFLQIDSSQYIIHLKSGSWNNPATQR